MLQEDINRKIFHYKMLSMIDNKVDTAVYVLDMEIVSSIYALSCDIHLTFIFQESNKV